MELKDLNRALVSPRGVRIVKDEEDNPYTLIEALYNAAFAEPKEGMGRNLRSRAYALGVRLGILMDKMESIPIEDRERENGSLSLKLSSEEVTLLKDLAAIRYGTLIYGILESILEEKDVIDA